ncbi:hypothetical protein KIH74_15105 [Kineosporia sp. J2-2]|uniref:Uncharacterized protein n=1 Tax=Kineosporia corallincola TaxID=2835133 RepID=A0ABS5TGP0_9ACTN|nr:DUF6880 family protein [Kineosporia corallincola]MBT0770268.1 hypothetical protein [Kineosporia corallincola]
MTDELSSSVDSLRWDRRRHPYHGRREYAVAVRTVNALGDELVRSGRAAEAVPQLRKAVDRVTRALMYLDDSPGIIGPQLRALMSLYARACTVAPPDPKSLGTWLVKTLCDGPGWPDVHLAEFAVALGPRGITAIERDMERRAAAADPDSWRDMWAIRELREQLAHVSGDVDRYVAVMSGDLGHPGRHLEIAQALAAAGRPDDAIAWARRGISEYTGHHLAGGVRDWLVAVLLERGEITQALDVRRTEFLREPTVDNYRSWAAIASAGNLTDPLPEALGTMRQRLATQPDVSAELVPLLLASGEHEEAWTIASAHRKHLSEQQWASVLADRGRQHPLEVLGHYQELIEQHALNQRDKQRYRRAVVYLAPLRAAYENTDRADKFTQYLNDLRQRHKIRPKFLQTLDAGGWFGTITNGRR